MQELNLQYAPTAVNPVIHVSQFDVGRQFKFDLFDGATAYVMPAGTTARVEGLKPDGHAFSYDNNIVVSGNVATITTTLQMTVIAGTVDCEIRFSNGSDDIGTLNFKLVVEKSPIDGNVDMSDTEIPAIINLARQEAENAEAWAAGTRGGLPVSSDDPAFENNAAYYAQQTGTDAQTASDAASAAATSEENAEAWAVGERNGTPVSSGDVTYENNAKYYAGEAATSETNAGTSAVNAASSASDAEAYSAGTRGGTPVSSSDPAYENNAAYYAGEAATSETNAGTSAGSAASSAEDAEAWAVGEKNGTPVPSGAAQYENNAKYWSDLAQQYAQSFSGLVFKGSIAYAAIPATGMSNGDMYDINEAFVTDARFEEGTGIACPAGTDIVWVESDQLWNILTPAGVYSFNGRAGAISPAANDYDASQIKFGVSSDVNTELGNKLATYAADATAWDTAPTNASTKPVTSGGVNTALGNKLATYAADATAWDTAPTNASTKPVTSGGAYTAIDNITPTVSSTDIGEGAPLANNKIYIVVS
ncbi:MAG: BppU family phage baseplate upper protein [Clostridia bacterium]|nr:BppU family phage baseplate upper protein [Clostridia bacterium]